MKASTTGQSLYQVVRRMSWLCECTLGGMLDFDELLLEWWSREGHDLAVWLV